MAEQSEPPEMERLRSAEDESTDDADSDQAVLRGISSLERLRDRVETAAHEMKRLREENANLSERIKELERRPAVDPKGTFLSLEQDPEQLKRKINTFIEAIDSYLERERRGS